MKQEDAEIEREEDIFPLRAHHGMCLHFFRGKGYSARFIANMTAKKHLLEEREMRVRVLDEVDALCAECPHRHGSDCRSAEKVAAYDRAVLDACGLTAGEVLPYAEFRALVEERILSAGKRREICGGCQWDAYC